MKFSCLEYDKERFVQVTAKDTVTGKNFTVYLKNISENKNGIVGTEVDKNGSFVKDNYFNGIKHIILNGAILKQQEIRLNQRYGKLEVPSPGRGIIPEKMGSELQLTGEVTERPSFKIITKSLDGHKKDFSNLFIKINNLTLSIPHRTALLMELD